MKHLQNIIGYEQINSDVFEAGYEKLRHERLKQKCEGQRGTRT